MAATNTQINVSIDKAGGIISSTQGALYHNGKIYQFADGGGCRIFDVNYNSLMSNYVAVKDTKNQDCAFVLPAYADNGNNPHVSTVEWIVPGKKLAVTTNASGLVNYADRFYIYDISDLSNITQDIVMMTGLDDKNHYKRMAALCYDQENKIMYVTGYQDSSDKTKPNWFESFDFSGYINNGTLSAPRLTVANSGEDPVLQAMGKNGLHLQDGGFYNGYLYYACDVFNTGSGSYDGVYLWVLDTNFKTVAVLDLFQSDVTKIVGNITDSQKSVLAAACTEVEAFFIIPGETCAAFVISDCHNGQSYYRCTIGNIPENWTPTVVDEETKIYYKVVFKDSDGTELASKVYSSNSTLVAPTSPTKDGYTFSGWTPAFPSNMKVTSNLTYTATYTQDTVSYTVTFKNYDSSVLKTETLASGTVITPPENPTRDGYVFTGWSPTFTTGTTATANVVYIAQFEEAASVEPTLKLNTTLNVSGYTVNGTNYNNDVELPVGTYNVTPIMRSVTIHDETLTAIFDSWSDDVTTATRTIVVSDTSVELSASGVMTTVYADGLPTNADGAGTSYVVSGTASAAHLSLNTGRVEYICAGIMQFNEQDCDVVTHNATSFDTNTKTYITEVGMEAGDRYFVSMPKNTIAARITIFKGTDEDTISNYLGSRNPNIMFVGGASASSIAKIYNGQNVDIARPVANSILTTGYVFDFSNIATSATTSVMDCLDRVLNNNVNLVIPRLAGASTKAYDGYVKIEFIRQGEEIPANEE